MKNLFSKIKEYLRNSFLELKKVDWPSRKETMKNTYSVIILSLIVALGLGFLDYLLLIVMKLILA